MSIPSSTYRIQLQAGFDFDAAIGVVDYLSQLGISHVYCSPYLQAAPGSTHGYDVVDYTRVNVELGGEKGLARFCAKLGSRNLGQVLDIVPNHMAIAGHYNVWWWDTLENGPASRYAPYFDIEWNAAEERLRNKVVLPLLGDHYGLVLAAGELTLERQGGHFVFRYKDHTFPIAPESMAELLGEAAERCGSSHLGFLADTLFRLSAADVEWGSLLAHHRNKEAVWDLLARLCIEHPEVGAAIDQAVQETNANIEELDALLSRQNYRLSRWRVAERELVYRRFFDINTLVGICTEKEQVFLDTHLLILEWLRTGQLDGVRVDHPDGLRDPAQYFQRLRSASPDCWIVAEKILAPDERLPDAWEIAGTTGYDFLSIAGGLFVDPRGEAPLNELYRAFTGAPVDFPSVAREKKHQILRELLGSDINRLTALFLQICEDNRDYRDYTRHEIHEAIRQVVACFPVYRTYIRAAAEEVSETDIRYVSDAIDAAKSGRPDLEERLFEFLRDVLLLRVQGPQEQEFVMRFQQITAAATAKGVEDTAFYCFGRLLSLNEVGGDPGRFGVTIDDFHKWCEEMQAHRPFNLLATSTHDTKRSEDTRIRISLLSENPSAWAEMVNRWSSSNARHRTGEYPDRKTEYFVYQTLVGTWPISRERLTGYMRKAVREARENTSWISPNAAFENSLDQFCESILADSEFTADLEKFLYRIIGAARDTSLSLLLLKLTAPGIPDIYQGTELWDLSLVDPDNRRPVDFELRKRLLAELDQLCPSQILARAEEGLPKLWTLRQALRIRNLHHESFGAKGHYTALWPTGPKSAHLVAFQRGRNVIVVVPRLLLNLESWDSTLLEIPEGNWRNQFTGDPLDGGKIEVGTLFRRFPVALLTREPVR
jgi:(1->4)-alpha-D-glucan 1-alpha-D-glucosylmutase